MDIVKELPFDICENCGEFILDIEQKTLWDYQDNSRLMLTVKCKNEKKCKRLKENLKGFNEP